MTVHVYGLPEDRDGLGEDERYCDGEDRGQLVVFHVQAMPWAGDDWACAYCGFDSSTDAKVAS